MLAVLTLIVALGAVHQPAAVYPASGQEAAVFPANRPPLICRREAEMGSIIKTRKMCMTSAEWARRSDDAQCETRRLLNLGTGQARIEC